MFTNRFVLIVTLACFTLISKSVTILIAPQTDLGKPNVLSEHRSDLLALPTKLDADKGVTINENQIFRLLPHQSEKIMDFLKEYRRLRGKISDIGMYMISTIGLLNGALKVEDSLRGNLYSIANQLISKFNVLTPKQNLDRLTAIEEIIARNKGVISILTSIMEFARKIRTIGELKTDMQTILKKVRYFWSS